MAPRKTKKSKQTQIPSISPEMQNMLAGVILLSLAILVFFSTQSTGENMPIL